MRRFSFALVLSICLVSCTNGDDPNDPLSQPPYKQMTDSIAQAPANADLYYRRGGLLFSNNQQAYAEADLRKAWEIDPREEYATGLIAILKQKNTDSAMVFIIAALKKLPGNIFLQIGLARAYQQKKQYEQAIAVCDEIITQHPNAVDALLVKAEILTDLDRSAEALATLEKAYEYAPGDPELVHQLAFAYAESKNKKVIALADSLIMADTEKRHAEPYYFKGVYYANVENYKEAIRQFDEAIRHDFNFLDAYINKGIAYYDQKKYDEAIKTFQLGIRVDPNFPDSFYWLGKTWEAKGNKQEAKSNYLKAYGLDKTRTEAKEAADRL